MDFYCEEKAEAAAIEKLEGMKNHRDKEIKKLGVAYEGLKSKDFFKKLAKELSAKNSHMYNRWLITKRYCLKDDEIRSAVTGVIKQQQNKKDKDQSRFSRFL
ncbi:MAG: hypothetical protein WCP56_02030 [Candidatus Saccharibacteria bacterium]